jgi:hypothetical protein
MNSIIHYRQVKQLNSMIDSYERKLDDKVNEMYQHVLMHLSRSLTHQQILTMLCFLVYKINTNTSLALKRSSTLLATPEERNLFIPNLLSLIMMFHKPNNSLRPTVCLKLSKA